MSLERLEDVGGGRRSRKKVLAVKKLVEHM